MSLRKSRNNDTEKRLSALESKCRELQEQVDYLCGFLPDDDETKVPDVEAEEQGERLEKASKLFSEGLDSILGYSVGGVRKHE